MMKKQYRSFFVISINVNGLRAAYKKGLDVWLLKQQPDVICFQETRLQPDFDTAPFVLPGYQGYFAHAEKKGYSGVGILTRWPGQLRANHLNDPCSLKQGRYLALELPFVTVASLYMPSGTSGPDYQAQKEAFMPVVWSHMQKIREDEKPWIIAGDWNIAMTEKDIKNWKNNQNHSGFLPHEREYMKAMVENLGYVDTLRECYPDASMYTWWSQRGGARQRDVGWRIDYQFISPGYQKAIDKVHVYREPIFSDHAPVCVTYHLTESTQLLKNISDTTSA